MILAAITPGRVLEASSVSHIAIAQESAYVICSEENATAAASSEQLSAIPLFECQIGEYTRDSSNHNSVAGIFLETAYQKKLYHRARKLWLLRWLTRLRRQDFFVPPKKVEYRNVYGIQELMRRAQEEKDQEEASARVYRPKVLANLEKVFSFLDGSTHTGRNEADALEDSRVVDRGSSSQEYDFESKPHSDARKMRIVLLYTCQYSSRRKSKVIPATVILVERESEQMGSSLLLNIRPMFPWGQVNISSLPSFGDCTNRDPAVNALAIVNSVAGRGKGREIWEKTVQPMLSVSRIAVKQVLYTKHTEHAAQIVTEAFSLSSNQSAVVPSFNAVMCVGGDGLLAEVASTLWTLGYYRNSDSVSDAVTLCPIPAGSTNTIVGSTLHEECPIHATLAVVLGKKVEMDVGLIQDHSVNKKQNVALSFASVGFFGRVAFLSSKLRWAGPSRYDIAGARYVFSGIKVRATVRVHEYWGKKDREVKEFQEIEGVFHAISIAIISCKCQKAKLGIAPNAAVDDGYLQVILVRAGNRLRMIRFLLNVAQGSKSLQQRSPLLKTLKERDRNEDTLSSSNETELIDDSGRANDFDIIACRKVEIDIKKSMPWNVDGEVIHSKTISLECLNRAIHLYSRDTNSSLASPSLT